MTYEERKKLFEEVYGLLVFVAGAPESEREMFVGTFAAPNCRTMEWRFRGNLGFGGKFWCEREGFRATCYHEDLNEKTRAILDKVNDALKPLFKRFEAEAKCRSFT